MKNEMVSRQSYDEIPPRVEYFLTEKGRSVVPILQSICQWSGAYHKEDPLYTGQLKITSHVKCRGDSRLLTK